MEHSTLREKAEIYKFSPTILRMALSMYNGARRIRCGKAFSKAVYTKVGVLAGCPIAMGLLLLANLDPVEKFWSDLPQHIISSIVNCKVYVDDFIVVFSVNRSKVTDDQIQMRVMGCAHETGRAYSCCWGQLCGWQT